MIELLLCKWKVGLMINVRGIIIIIRLMELVGLNLYVSYLEWFWIFFLIKKNFNLKEIRCDYIFIDC